jgi:hypothetical protein
MLDLKLNEQELREKYQIILESIKALWRILSQAASF